MSFVSRPDVFQKVLDQTLRNVEMVGEGVLEQVTGKELSTPGDQELHGADYLAWYHDLAERGILQIVAELDAAEGTHWAESWAEQYDREAEKLGLV